MYQNLIIFFFSLFLLTGSVAQESDDYPLGPFSKQRPGVPQGTITKHLFKSDLYNNYRYYHLYVPAQYNPEEPAALIVFQDGHFYSDTSGYCSAPHVLNNLIDQGDIPVMIGLFIEPGHPNQEFPENPFRNANRSNEYDEVSDRYSRFLIEELIPEISRQYNITEDPEMRAIGGLSSGGICAFNVAWQRPDYFHKVISHSGSFTNIRGGHVFPDMIRRSPKKDIKVFLQCGTNDLDLIFGNWWLSNKQMESALHFREYDFRFVEGTGEHDGHHGCSILPETLIWLWND